jgi:hypothetical protein
MPFYIRLSRKVALRCLFSVAFLFAALPADGRAAPTPDCHIGSYRLNNGELLDVDSADDGALRWLKFTGERGGLHQQKDGSWTSTYGWTDRPDGRTVRFSDCAVGTVNFNGFTGHRIDFDVTNLTFESDGVKLAGRLVMPKGNARVPVVVLVHGSEHDSALDNYAMQRTFPAQGIGVFVYDKRGTGTSGSTYTQDFNVLAGDAVAALKEATRLAGNRLGRIGYQGGSEAGWVIPLAASRVHADFAIISFGLAVTVLQEDQESVALDMHFHHHSAADTVKALQLARSGEHVVETDGREGYETFDALRRKYESEPWYKDVHGDFLFAIMPLNRKQIIDTIAQYGFQATPFRYEPMPVLRASRTPQLWVLGSDDLEAPSAETARRIRGLIAKGKNFTLALYPGAEHGMTDYELNAKGERVDTRFAPGYFQMMADFIRRGRIGDHYGNAIITLPKPR